MAIRSSSMFKNLLYAGNKVGRFYKKLTPAQQRWGAAGMGLAGMYSLGMSRKSARRRAPITAGLYGAAGIGLGMASFHSFRGNGSSFFKGAGLRGFSKISGRNFFK